MVSAKLLSRICKRKVHQLGLSESAGSFCRVLKSIHLLLLKLPNGTIRGKNQNRFHQVNPAAPKPPYDHIAQAIDKKKRPYGASMSFQYGVDGNRHGVKNATAITATAVKIIPNNPCMLFP